MSRRQSQPPKSVGTLTSSADLIVVVALVALINLVALADTDWAIGQAVLGIALVMFLPGYALVAALFPETGPSPTDSASSESIFSRAREGGIDGVERASLSFALSIAVVPLLVIGMRLSPLEVSLAPTILTISVFTILCSVVAVFRRLAVPPDERFRVPVRGLLSRGKAGITNADRQRDAFLNVALAVAVVLAIGTLVFGVVATPDGERYTEFYVLTENGTGELTAMDYPESLSPGDPSQFQVGIENYEERTVTYTVVAQLQRVDERANDSVVADRAEIDRFSTELGHNDTSIETRDLTAPDQFSGEERRLVFFLYDNSVPERPTAETADQRLHIWVDVDGDG